MYAELLMFLPCVIIQGKASEVPSARLVLRQRVCVCTLVLLCGQTLLGRLLQRRCE